MAAKLLDVTGLACPLPVMKAAKAIAELKPGDRLEVVATDPGAVEDFEVFCETKGHTLVEQGRLEQTFRFLIEKGQ